MSFCGDGYSTLEEQIEAQASPILERSHLNFDSLDTPPPYVDAPDDYSSSDTEVEDNSVSLSRLRTVSRSQPKPSLCDSLLITALGPIYPPEIAARAGTELLCDISDQGKSASNSSKSSNAHEQMIGIDSINALSTSSSSERPGTALPAAQEASQLLHDALDRQYRSMSIHSYGKTDPEYYRKGSGSPIELTARSIQHNINAEHVRKASIESIIQVREVSPSSESTYSKDSSSNVRHRSRPILPHLEIAISSSVALMTNENTCKSPAFVRHAITPLESHPSQTLARIYSSSPPESSSAAPLEARQTLPSLQTALNSATDSNGAPYLGPSPSLTASALSQATSPFSTSTATYTQTSPNAHMSPPRLPTNPSFWRTGSQNSSVSTPPDHASANISASASTPASSLPALSPAASFYTPNYTASDLPLRDGFDIHHESDKINDAYADTAHQVGSSLQGFRCTWPGCTAPPFQTQYLLNSHTNVHSNTRPHFCPVRGCPRGPGGQGFKRKNEMIRHGLVHQSPGYVCPFCPDQQHKYPRPDNLQRHVRVHHVDKDRDHPLLREVLAQRPEGGNRGRRRRIGT